MNRPMISIILTTYNRCELLPRAVQSVFDGGYQNFELIIVDDASQDGTQKLVEKLEDARIQYVRMSENGGVLRARNRGFDLANGDYVAILDDDDELVPGALSCVIAKFEDSAAAGADILWFDCRDVEAGHKSGSMPVSDGLIEFEDYLCGRVRGDFWLVFRRIALENNRFDEELRAHESLLWLRIHRTHRAYYSPTTLCLKYREHGGDRLCDLSVRIKQLTYTTLALRRFIEEFGVGLQTSCPTLYGSRLAYLGLHQMAINEFAAGRVSIWQSLKYRFSLKYASFLIVSFFVSGQQVARIIQRMES